VPTPKNVKESEKNVKESEKFENSTNYSGGMGRKEA